MKDMKDNWIESEKYLPIFLRGEENQQRLLKALYYKMKRPKMNLFGDEIIPIEQAQQYAFELLKFLADYGYVLKKLRFKEDFLSIEDEFNEYEIGLTRNVSASASLVAWMNKGFYLPDFLFDFHDNKDFFFAYHNEKDRPLESMITGVTYITDSFLWYMARFGYGLRKVNKKFDFKDLDVFISEHLEIKRNRFEKMIENAIKES